VSNDEAPPEPQETAADQLTDELARKYDPERLLKIIGKRAGKGQSLDVTVRNRYERKFGVDLGHVRVFTGEFAEEFNKQRGSYAVTVGGTGMILMGNSPEKAAGTRAGEALLAHELTHVAQAQRGLHNRARQAEFTHADEVEAHAVEHEVEQGQGDGQHASGQAAQQMEAERNADEARKDAIEKIKARVLEMMGEAARNQYLRNGVTRRP
jgi:hypothetical protein